MGTQDGSKCARPLRREFNVSAGLPSSHLRLLSTAPNCITLGHQTFCHLRNKEMSFWDAKADQTDRQQTFNEHKLMFCIKQLLWLLTMHVMPSVLVLFFSYYVDWKWNFNSKIVVVGNVASRHGLVLHSVICLCSEFKIWNIWYLKCGTPYLEPVCNGNNCFRGSVMTMMYRYMDRWTIDELVVDSEN